MDVILPPLQPRQHREPKKRWVVIFSGISAGLVVLALALLVILWVVYGPAIARSWSAQLQIAISLTDGIVSTTQK